MTPVSENPFQITKLKVDSHSTLYESGKSPTNSSTPELTIKSERVSNDDDIITNHGIGKSISKNTGTEDDDENLVTKNPFHFFQKSDLWLLIPALVFNAMCAATDIASTIMINKLFKHLTKFQNGGYTTPSSFISAVSWPCFGIMLIGLGTMLLGWLETTLFTYLGERQQIRCRKKLFDSLLARRLSWFKSNSNLDGDLIQLNRSVEEFRSSISEYLSVLFKSIFSIISLMIISMIYSWKLTLLIMSIIPIIIFTIAIFGQYIHKWAEREDEETAKSISLLDWNFTSFLWIKIIFAKDLELAQFAKLLDNCEYTFRNFSIYANIVSSIMKFLSLMLFVQSFWFGSYLVRTHKDDPNDIISSFYSCLKLAMTISQLSMIAVIFQKANTSFKKVVRFLLSDEDIEKFNQTLLVPDEPLYGDIRIQNVIFDYNSTETENQREITNKTILKNISLTIEPFKTTYLVGKSGSGKSTIANLLLKLYSPTAGEITIDGHSLDKLDDTWLREQITLVQQFPKLFNDTIEHNILLGTPFDNIDSPSVTDTVTYFNLSKLIANLPNGYQTYVGKNTDSHDRIVQLSGGEEQRLNLIKARLRDSNILILDESISALDINQRELFMQKINQWRENKTTIIITHELSHIRDNDMVFFIEHGRIVESGRKRELVGEKGRFADMELQGNFKQESGKRYQHGLNKRKSIFDDIKDLESQQIKTCTDKTGADFVIEEEEKLDNIRAPILIAYRLLINSLPMKYKVCYAVGLFLVLAEAIMTPIFSYCFSNLINGIIPQVHGSLIAQHTQLKWSMIATAIAFITGALSFISQTALEFVAERLCKNLQQAALEKTIKQDVPFFEYLNANELSTLIMNDIRDFRMIFSNNLARLVSGISISVVCIIWNLTTGWKYALVGFSMFPLFGIFSFIGTALMQKVEFAYKDSLNQAESVIYETRNGIKTIMCLNVQEHFKVKFSTKLDIVLRNGLKRSIAMGFSINSIFFLANFAQSIMLYYGMKLISTGEYTLVKMMQIVMMILMSVTFLSELMSSAPGLYRGLRVALKLDKLVFKLDDDDNIQSGYLTPALKAVQTENCISFNNVTFAYPSDPHHPVLRNFSMDIPKHQLVTIVGESGCGKSTIMSLMLRLYSTKREAEGKQQYPATQEIQVDGYDIDTIKLSHLLSNYAVVTQKHYFFNGTIKENLLYGNPARHSISDADIMHVLDDLDLQSLVLDLEKGLDAPLCTSGNILVSGGQAQRFSIARALLRPATILLLDECTASLDAGSSEIVIDILTRLKSEKKTVICITHQESIMRRSDLIHVIENGQVVESGDFNTIMGNGGAFYNMVRKHVIS